MVPDGFSSVAGGSPQVRRAQYLTPPRAKRQGLALCLSGGGYRAALFHLGVLRRLNQLGILAKVDTISAVSGGSILAAFLAQRVIPWPASGPIQGFDEKLVPEFRDFTRKNIRTLWVVRRLWPLNWPNSAIAVEALARRYEKDIVQLAPSDLPARPAFCFCATDMTWGVNWRFERDRMGSYQAGYVEPPPGWKVARSVAASSCFPPAFEPMPVGLAPDSFTGGDAEDTPEYVSNILGLRLSDGGVYDNLGLEPVWKTHETVLVSDGGATFDPKPDAGTFGRLGRYLSVQGNQANAVRKRWLINSFENGDYSGTYMGIGSAVHSYEEEAQGYDRDLVDRVVSEVRTDLDYFTDAEAAVLQNHGYLLAEVATRRWVPSLRDPGAPPPSVPEPDWMAAGKVAEALAGSGRRQKLGRWRLIQQLMGEL